MRDHEVLSRSVVELETQLAAANKSLDTLRTDLKEMSVSQRESLFELHDKNAK